MAVQSSLIVGVLVVLCALWAGGSSAASFNEGLGPNVPVPSWAKHRHIHFFRTAPSTPRMTGELSEQGVSGETNGYLGRRCEERPGGVCPEPPMLYNEHGKGVQHSPHVYAIFWGGNWNKEPGLAVRTQLEKMYSGLSGSAYQGILSQYFDSTGRISKTAVTLSAYTDATTAPTAPTNVEDAAIKAEVAAAIEANKERGWGYELDAQFIVIPAPGTTYNFGGFCAYHSIVGSPESTYTFVPYVGDKPFLEGCAGYDREKNVGNVSSMLAAHEYGESATDPIPGEETHTWWGPGGLQDEIGDICASGDDQITEGSLNGSWVQGLWDDHQSACSLSDPEPPHVYAVTEGAGGMSTQIATLHGTVNPEAAATHYYFEYGPTTSYGSKTPEQSAGSGINNVSVSQTISGLTEQVYHYRLVTTNSSGTTDGEDRTFPSSSWSVQASVNVSGRPTVLKGVSCVSASFCVGVGQAEGAGPGLPVAEQWNGMEWSLMTVPAPEAGAQFTGVSCSSVSSCVAVGVWTSSPIKTFAETWNGTSWSIRSAPTQGTASELLGVSCTSASSCTAVGWYRTAETEEVKPLAEYWNGNEFALQPVPVASGAVKTKLLGVACTSSVSCVAVGSFSKEIFLQNENTFAASWNGTEWAVQSSPNPTGAEHNSLKSVSCASSTYCIAVGSSYFNGSGGLKTLAESWNGSSWSIGQSTNPASSENELLGVSCTSSTACMAVGYGRSESRFEAVVEAWNGSEWSSHISPSLPSGGRSPQLKGVYCTTANACTAVGRYMNSKNESVTLVERTIPPWMVQSPPNPVAPTTNTLTGVSCSSSASCMAVGHSYSQSVVGSLVNLAEYWNGTEWSIQKTLNVGTVENELNGVSCASSTACTAVGMYSNASGSTLALIEAWNGVSWSTQSTPTPSGGTKIELKGVSCSSTTACTAVGLYKNSGGEIVTLAERWNGTEWTIQATPNVSGKPSELKSVSCASSTLCVAVGLTEGSGSGPLAERWNGTEWTIMSLPAGGTELDSASCSSSSSCIAVGKSGENVFSERWNGAEWTILTTPNPSGGSSNQLLGVSCTSASTCTAVGKYVGEGLFRPLAEFWNGTEWAIQTTPYPAETLDQLSSVSCTTSTACTAVGSYGAVNEFSSVKKTLAEQWNGVAWSYQSPPNPVAPTTNTLTGVSCSSSASCMAVGHSYNQSVVGSLVNLAEYWNGTEWSIQKTLNVGTVENELNGVSCASSTACTAVGMYSNASGSTLALIEAWNGVSWSTQSTPTPSGGTKIELKGVSCSSTTACTAVGLYKNSGGEIVTLAERWNGTEWTIQATPNVSGKPSELKSVSCASSTLCVAVGLTEGSGSGPLAERWNGTEWTIMSLPAGGTELESVSCASSSSCIAAGKSSGNVFSERWNGAEWTILTTPNPSGGSSNQLLGVSCTSASTCTAVGKYVGEGLFLPLAEFWNGTEWAIQTTPYPAETLDQLSSVSCTTSTSCTAAGSYGKGFSSVEKTLAERYE